MRLNSIVYLLLIIGISFSIFQCIIQKKEIIEENNKIKYTIEKITGLSNKNDSDSYDAILSIPQINMKEGIYKDNYVKNKKRKNVIIYELSDYPDKRNSNLVLMIYSNNRIKDLERLNNDSLIEFYYRRVKYVYKINTCYTSEKNNIDYIERDKNKKTITLIISNKNKNKKTLIYIGYLIDEIRY